MYLLDTDTLTHLYAGQARVIELLVIMVVPTSASSRFGLLLCLLYALTRAASDYRMPYWDEIGFMEDFEQQLRPKVP